MSSTQLHEVVAEYELVIKELNETLVLELALRDEREFDKELKNQFISLLLTIQKKRREGNVDKRKRKARPANHYNVNNNLSPETGAVSQPGPFLFLMISGNLVLDPILEIIPVSTVNFTI